MIGMSFIEKCKSVRQNYVQVEGLMPSTESKPSQPHGIVVLTPHPGDLVQAKRNCMGLIRVEDFAKLGEKGKMVEMTITVDHRK